MIYRLRKLWSFVQFVLAGTRSVSRTDRFRIALRVRSALRKNPGRSASTFGEQLVLISSILEIPPDATGSIAEFGCYKGLSSVALSIAAKYSGRKLLVFDSFEGLPESTESISHIADNTQFNYKKGDLAGSLGEVRGVIEQYGEISCVEFIKGYFCDTLPRRPVDEKYVLIFEDADLVESVRDVLRHAWPRLGDGRVFFSHESLDLEVVKLFYDDEWWKKTHGVKAPGLAGAGLGLPIDAGNWGSVHMPGLRGSCLAYCLKRRNDAPPASTSA